MNKTMVSVIVPTYNEAGSILDLVNMIHETLKPYTHEILIVDDNSPDGTYKLVESLASTNSSVKAILRTKDKGFAKSIRTGIERSQGDYLVIMDSDFNHDPRHIPFMLNSLNEYDAVFASRFLYGGRGASTRRHIASWSFNIFLRILTDGRITDNLFGYFSIRRDKIFELSFDSIFMGFGDYCIRLLFFMQSKGHTILQIPVVIGERRAGVGNQRKFRTLFQYTMTAIDLILKNGRVKIREK